MKTECLGRETFKGYLDSPEACADSCRMSSEMFIFGSDQHGVTECDATGLCPCYCEHDTESSKCVEEIENLAYDLYVFQGKCNT